MTPINQPHPEGASKEGGLRRWIREPAPGQFRGEGEWRAYRGTEDYWLRLVETGFLPTFVGEAPPALYRAGDRT